jgi:hypothetical protein
VAEIPWGHNVWLIEKVKTPAVRLWYALRDVAKPVGIARYVTKLVEALPDDLKGELPTIEQIQVGSPAPERPRRRSHLAGGSPRGARHERGALQTAEAVKFDAAITASQIEPINAWAREHEVAYVAAPEI